MAKKRKTRQEKIIADLRRKVAMQEPPPPLATTTNMYSIPTIKISSPIARSQPPEARSYTYVLADLRKTVLLTAIALAAQIGLYVVLAR